MDKAPDSSGATSPLYRCVPDISLCIGLNPIFLMFSPMSSHALRCLVQRGLRLQRQRRSEVLHQDPAPCLQGAPDPFPHDPYCHDPGLRLVGSLRAPDLPDPPLHPRPLSRRAVLRLPAGRVFGRPSRLGGLSFQSIGSFLILRGSVPYSPPRVAEGGLKGGREPRSSATTGRIYRVLPDIL